MRYQVGVTDPGDIKIKVIRSESEQASDFWHGWCITRHNFIKSVPQKTTTRTSFTQCRSYAQYLCNFEQLFWCDWPGRPVGQSAADVLCISCVVESHMPHQVGADMRQKPSSGYLYILHCLWGMVAWNTNGCNFWKPSFIWKSEVHFFCIISVSETSYIP